jgi:DNA-binding NtrC family response regulator
MSSCVLDTESDRPDAEARTRSLPADLPIDSGSSPGDASDRFIGASLEARNVRSLVQRIARSCLTVLITGETGTGKELVARAVHDVSGRSPWVGLAVTELSEGIVESELFGHERGAFTGAVTRHVGLFERADGGTLFLDEIGDAPPTVQAKLLRVLETGEVRPVGGATLRRTSPRVIVATHRDLPLMVREGTFRRDLYYRIRQVHIHVPPLRERPDDVDPIVRSIIGQLCLESGLAPPAVSEHLLRALRGHPWLGNVRELRSVLQNVLLSWDGRSPLDEELLLEAVSQLDPAFSVGEQGLVQAMVEAYRRAGGNQEAARRSLGMTRAEWRGRWSKFGLADVTRRRRGASIGPRG